MRYPDLSILPHLFPPFACFCPLPAEVRLLQFHEPGIYNYSVLLLSEDQNTLYVGAREAVFALKALNISEKQHEVCLGLAGPLGLHLTCLLLHPRFCSSVSGFPLAAPAEDALFTFDV